jgi:hypothetical protein
MLSSISKVGFAFGIGMMLFHFTNAQHITKNSLGVEMSEIPAGDCWGVLHGYRGGEVWC